MTTPVWAPGTLYSPGALVRPLSVLPPVADPVANGDFEAGNVDWTLVSGFTIGEFGPGKAFQGTWSLQWNQTGTGNAINNNTADVVPGQVINGSFRVEQDFANNLIAYCMIAWYDASDNFISFSVGTGVSVPALAGWQVVSVAGTAPAGAAIARFAVRVMRLSGTHIMWVDNCVWDAVSAAGTAGLIFRAVQTVAGYSGASEPAWPLVNGQQVVDNQVTWEATYASRVVWEASPILVSGSYEPTWPTVPNSTVADGTIAWLAMDARVTDPKCPNSKIVIAAASKIFAGDGDIIPFSATTNPLDWSTVDDAGFLPFGLNAHGSTPVSALGLYRSNLVAFNSQGYQMWQVDEDPANMALLDASPVDCPYHKSVKPVMNDLVFGSARGIRNIGIAGASTNIQAGFFGKAIDPLYLAKIRAGEIPNSLFWPGAGQYWSFFGAEVFVLTMNGGPKDSSWSRYIFPEALTDWAILGTTLFLRAGDLVWEVSEEALDDDMPVLYFLATEDGDLLTTEAGDNLILEGSEGDSIPFEGYLAWPYLDWGMLGVDKQMEGFDLVITGSVRVQFGYSESNFNLVTPEYPLDGDTLPGMMVPMPITGPSFQMRLTFDATQAWEWSAASMYLTDLPGGR